MSFNEEGFLSVDLAEWSIGVGEQLRVWFDMADGLNRDAMRLLLVVQPPSVSVRQLVALQLYRRALQSFQGSILLARRGMIADTLSLGRACTETSIAIGAVANDAGFIAQLIEAQDNHLFTYSNALLNDPDSLAFFSQEQVNNINQTVDEIRARYQPRTPAGISWEQAARTAGMTDLYITTYRLTSGDAVHVTLSAMDRHLEPNDQGAVGTLTFRPETRQLAHALSIASNSLLHAIEAMLRIFQTESFEQTLRIQMERWAALSTTAHEPTIS
jgi:Family of unknown function (DUF5677)